MQSAKDIFIFRHTLLVSAGYDITPLLNANFATMFTPDFSNFIIFPTLTYSVVQNLDALLAVQHFVSQIAGKR
ncbi:MAG: hypothetical protein U5L96_17990 [Owenweeksia sp.]|nr:hypothetical protein [Owenweeksia sp.]